RAGGTGSRGGHDPVERAGTVRREEGRRGEVRGQGGRGPRSGLDEELRRLDGGPYGRYKSLVGTWRMPGGGSGTLQIVRGQADPFAPPARVAVRLPGGAAGFPE